MRLVVITVFLSVVAPSSLVLAQCTEQRPSPPPCSCGYPQTAKKPCVRCIEKHVYVPYEEREEEEERAPEQELGGYAAPPPTGEIAGESQRIGIEGFSIAFPAFEWRLPGIRFPAITRYRRRPRMELERAVAPYVRDYRQEISIETAREELALERAREGVPERAREGIPERAPARPEGQPERAPQPPEVPEGAPKPPCAQPPACPPCPHCCPGSKSCTQHTPVSPSKEDPAAEKELTELELKYEDRLRRLENIEKRLDQKLDLLAQSVDRLSPTKVAPPRLVRQLPPRVTTSAKRADSKQVSYEPPTPDQVCPGPGYVPAAPRTQNSLEVPMPTRPVAAQPPSHARGSRHVFSKESLSRLKPTVTAPLTAVRSAFGRLRKRPANSPER